MGSKFNAALWCCSGPQDLSAQPHIASSPPPSPQWLSPCTNDGGISAPHLSVQVPGVKRVDANDLDPAVCASMRRNVAFNGPTAEERIRVLSSDARVVMMQSPNVRGPHGAVPRRA